MQLASRNDSEGFALRTLKNLEYLERKRSEERADVHLITQLTISLLGLIVFPWERKFKDHLKDVKLSTLGWPRWDIWKDDKGDCDTLEKLVFHIRNGVAHGHIEFTSDAYSSDSRELDKIIFNFKDRPRDKGPWNWCARINGADLREFCYQFVREVGNTIG